nr:hypothetical protein PanWU01x14_018550 [Ipomoea batatas]
MGGEAGGLNLEDIWNVNWILMNAVSPGSVQHWRLNAPITFPNCTVTLESTPERNLPHSIPSLHSPLSFNDLDLDLLSLRLTTPTRNFTSSDTGSTRGPMLVIFAFNASPATSIREGRSGGEHAAVDDENIDVFGIEVSLSQKMIHN